MEGFDNKKRTRVDSVNSDELPELETDSPEVKRLREDLLSCLDESDPGTTDPDLDLFMKSFEEEISAAPAPETFPRESPELGYLLEASDDELGLPPSNSSDDVAEVVKFQSESGNGLSDLWKLDDDQVPSYDSFEFGVGFDCYDPVDGGLFDYADIGGGAYDDTVSLWRPEAEPAV